ncbi:unnamed protein product [Thelazia callipaeda]|uniref:PPM-type phosphatase domain-containing protein n=1 Tax=Thelazia callipaeda TaxID=103827 RepID=A0A0N5CRM5_THECL|nr:unnamed protein product [Thelazia callipaeda]
MDNLDYLVLLALGDTALKRLCVLTAQPDVVRVDLNEISLKFILVASDGFWDVLSNEEAIGSAQAFLCRASDKWHEYVIVVQCFP